MFTVTKNNEVRQTFFFSHFDFEKDHSGLPDHAQRKGHDQAAYCSLIYQVHFIHDSPPFW